MSTSDRERLVGELRRAFDARVVARSPVEADASAAPLKPISFTLPLLQAVLAGVKTETRRPIRPVPVGVRDGVAYGGENVAIVPPFVAGDRLWIREKWGRRADGTFVWAVDSPIEKVKWIASRFMPREAARHFLRVDSVAIARVGEITDADAEREGWPGEASTLLRSRAWFIATWDSIYGDGEFASGRDPWVWIVRFSRVATSVTS